MAQYFSEQTRHNGTSAPVASEARYGSSSHAAKAQGHWDSQRERREKIEFDYGYMLLM